MLTRREKCKASLFLLSSVIVFAAALALLAGWRPGRDTVSYYVVFAGSVSGLGEQSVVRLNGFEIGWVERIELDSACPTRVRVMIGVERRHAPLPAGIRARKLTVGLTGSCDIDLVLSDDPAATKPPGDAVPFLPEQEGSGHPSAAESGGQDELAPGSTIPGELGPMDAMTRLLCDDNVRELERILAGVNDTIDQVRRVLESNEHAVGTTIADVRDAARALKRFAERLERDPSSMVYPRHAPEKQTYDRGR